jgi:hypothetical protein
MTFELPSDLVQIETSPDKVESVEADSTAGPEEKLAGRPRRTRVAADPMPSEPLVQVETRH